MGFIKMALENYVPDMVRISIVAQYVHSKQIDCKRYHIVVARYTTLQSKVQ
jgi:hypothetical protein